MDDEIIERPRASEQPHYTKLRLHRNPLYSGPCENLQADEAQALLCELMRFFDLPHHLPLPPSGLPGHFDEPDAEIMDIVREGVRYLRAICDGEKKTLWNTHKRIAEAQRQSYWAGHNASSEQTKEEQRQEIIVTSSRLSEQAREIEAATFVYFIQSATGDIKIGSARDIGKRLKGLQTAHPVKLTLLASCQGGQPVEVTYHRQFAAHRLHGEWFSPHPDILAEIERIKETAA